MKKIIVCPDSFKGTFTAKEVSHFITQEIKKHLPEIEIIEIPLADGGEGTADILKGFYPHVVETKAHDPIGRLINTRYYVSPENKVFIESAEIIGLPLLKENERNPIYTSSRGLGELIREVIEKGYKEITVSLGGSSTCDGGFGMMENIGENLKGVKFNVLCDVTNPLLGEEGAARVFAPQKGASQKDILILEKRLENYVDKCVLNNLCYKEEAFEEGAGAAGGLGFAFQSLLKATRIKGIDFILDHTNFGKKIQDADIIITGEGKVDSQSLMGKVLSGVLSRSFKYNIPVITIGGKIEDTEKLYAAGVYKAYEISDPLLSLKENMDRKQTLNNIKKVIQKIIIDFQ